MNNLEVIKRKRPEVKEKIKEKEKLAERKKFQRLCVEYHTAHGKEWNMNSLKVDRDLYKKFKAVNIKLLPDHLKWIYWHRFAYVQAMVQLGRSGRIVNFVKKYQKILGTRQLQPSEFNKLYKRISASAEYKALTKADFQAAKLAMQGSITLLSGIKVDAGWEQKAKAALKPDTVDDKAAYTNLLGGFKLIQSNIKKIERRKFVTGGSKN